MSRIRELWGEETKDGYRKFGIGDVRTIEGPQLHATVAFGLQLVPGALQHLDGTTKVLLISSLLPAAFLAILLNPNLPKEAADDAQQ